MDGRAPGRAGQPLAADSTLRKIERADPTVALGTVLDVAVLVGVPLFGGDAVRVAQHAEHIEDRLALLPDRVTPIDDVGLDDAF